ncbi:MAG: hypothetical protein EOO12_00015 [Chitinophagaceae bacterium]|nr:MAG: hypothetical protein EOO12_00015 [Chitinophagaceae bacterium]
MMAQVRGTKELKLAAAQAVADHYTEGYSHGVEAERRRAVQVAKTAIQDFFLAQPDLWRTFPAIALRDDVVSAIESGQP